MTQKVKKMTRSRSGNGPPPTIMSGRASAAASDTPPRMPVQATISTLRQEGGRSRGRKNFLNKLEGKAAGMTQAMRTTTTVKQTSSASQSRESGARLASASRMLRNCRSEEHTSELQSHSDLVCRLLLEKKK